MGFSLLHYFHIPIIHLVYPPKFCRSIVFKFSWEDCKSQEKLETMLMQNFWRLNKMYYGNVKVATSFSHSYKPQRLPLGTMETN